MKSALAFVCLIVAAMCSSAPSLRGTPELQQDKQAVYLILKGVLEGVGEQTQVNIDTIFSCVHDSETVVTDLFRAVQLVRSNDFNNVKEGIRLIGEAIQVLPDAITECRSSEAELQKLANVLTSLLEELRHPIKFAFVVGKNLLLNGRDIYSEIETAVQDWQTQQYEDFGRQVGRILSQLVLRHSVPELALFVDQTQDVVVIFEGVLKGFAYAGGIRVQDFQNCIDGTETTVNDFMGAVQLFRENNSQSVLEGLRLLGQGIQALPDAITACQSSVSEAITLATKLARVITEIQNPQQYAFHVGKDLVVNGRDIYREINKAVQDWNNQDYADFGFQVGEALYQIFVGVTQIEQ